MQRAPCTPTLCNVEPLRQTRVASGCSYCEGFLRSNAVDHNSPWNTIILESSNFVVIPTLGMLVPGWLLIVTKSHYLSMGALSSSLLCELRQVANETRRMVAKTFGAPAFFEHGPAASTKSVGSCIDHAHWHVVPNVDAWIAEDDEHGLDWQQLDSLSGLYRLHSNQIAYLYWQSADRVQQVSCLPQVPSQYLRRLVAKHIGSPHKWDWALYSGSDNLQITLERLTRRYNSPSANG